ncbi:MAG: metallophosphoesterase family protein [Gemmatimonadota bacterium]|nr:metallophosphoesterase family protein [Gemmatimonadota bacterium]
MPTRAIYILVLPVFLSCAGIDPAPDTGHSGHHNASYDTAAHDPRPSPVPDRIVLTWNADPSNSQAVTWRTDASVVETLVEIALASASPRFMVNVRKVPAQTQAVVTESGAAHYHSATIDDLIPGTLYAYRVGSGDLWSEWFHFRTALDKPAPFTFIYLGDAQNNILSLWSRTIRAAYATEPEASFVLHAGDLVNRANRDGEWGEWFRAGAYIHATVNAVPTPGNHEYAKDKEGRRRLSRLWRPHFTLPQNGPEGLKETVYHFDYQGARIISLNSNEERDDQVPWLESVLRENPNRWTFITFHHPVYSTGKGRDNKALREQWKPLFDRYRVDLVLQGHDHSYGRGSNLPSGTTARDERDGTVYVVSVSGPKQYKLSQERWWRRAAENTQLYQTITVDGDTLRYEARTATSELYDAFDLIKQEGAPNVLVNRIPDTPARTHLNTIGGRK